LGCRVGSFVLQKVAEHELPQGLLIG